MLSVVGSKQITLPALPFAKCNDCSKVNGKVKVKIDECCILHDVWILKLEASAHFMNNINDFIEYMDFPTS